MKLWMSLVKNKEFPRIAKQSRLECIDNQFARWSRATFSSCSFCYSLSHWIRLTFVTNKIKYNSVIKKKKETRQIYRLYVWIIYSAGRSPMENAKRRGTKPSAKNQQIPKTPLSIGMKVTPSWIFIFWLKSSF